MYQYFPGLMVKRYLSRNTDHVEECKMEMENNVCINDGTNDTSQGITDGTLQWNLYLVKKYKPSGDSYLQW